MRKIMIAAVLLSAGVLSAQEAKPKHEIQDQMVKSTYYYESGQVKQQGFYKDGRLHGTWVAYNEDGTKQSMGEYNNGVKTGKWFFWTGSELNEVDYADSRIAEVKKWSHNAVVSNK
ncbi:membrane-binding protein [Flavobacterium sp. MFBS3-15]|uniref:toxin-antitoxin system YwqK family antitoxin n=1 Tax=Flavobacterium sp. MFBS3-15 TaxID=2989816 RepID=UPI0022355432|nr:membrane-binding protein [Flavobacterium sp. MFBS3-15]MCW4469728.1 membrane-binding protein [Flavobacterium sp. MFBS3-15]